MGIVYEKNKKNGTVYVYSSESYYRPDKKRCFYKRKLLGKLNPETGEVEPTGPRGRPRKDGSIAFQELGKKSPEQQMEQKAAVPLEEAAPEAEVAEKPQNENGQLLGESDLAIQQAKEAADETGTTKNLQEEYARLLAENMALKVQVAALQTALMEIQQVLQKNLGPILKT